MFWEGNLNNLQLNNCFWNIWVALKRAYGGYETHPDWLATEEVAAVEAVLWWWCTAAAAAATEAAQ